MSSSREACRGRHHARPEPVELLRPLFPRLSSLPIARPASAMCNGHNLNPIVGNSIHDLERKAAEEIAASAVHEQRPAFWRFRDGFDPVIDPRRGRIPQRTDFFRDTTAKPLGPLQLRQDGEQGAGPASATEDLSASITPRNNTIRRYIEVL